MFAAKWMGVNPWELIEQDDEWIEWARTLMSIEHKGQARQQGKKGGKR